ncbi:glycosyltransferase [Pararhodobacter marinus]|uniref:glycosyltransferase n=1 Tax=Pararhodobacter marinus TaxID=2184063 RepID=UPI003514A49F
MRILYYNWADYLDRERRGGGVSVYQRNVINGMAAHEDIETAFLSSGLSQEFLRRKPHVITVEGGKSPRYTLVNSGLIAPSHADFGGRAQLDDPATEAAFADFVDRTGPWDVIHFNNLEGLPANVLNLKRRWPGTKFVLSLHNYYPFCPQVNLWYAEREHCDDFHGGSSCTRCLAAQPEPRSIRTAYAIAWTFARTGLGPGTRFYDHVFRPAMRLAWRSLRRILNVRRRRQMAEPVRLVAAGAGAGASASAQAAQGGNVPTVIPAASDDQRRAHPKPSSATPAEAFARRRARFVSLINAHCDSVLCVSDRVRQIALHHGIHASKLQTSYIGSAEAGEWHYSRPRTTFLHEDGTLRIAYLGYMRRDKGYHFLMRALAALPAEQAARVRLKLAALPGDGEAMGLLADLRGHLAEVTHIAGYSHDDLKTMLADVDLGVVPVVWEDNLPQVAIEMHSRHIPLITSDRGGAQELGRCNDLVFRADSIDAFHKVMSRLLDGSVTPANYWANAIAPVSVQTHIEELLQIYRETP